MMSLLSIYRGCEKQERKGDDEYHYYSQTETKLNNERDLVRNKSDISPNRLYIIHQQ